MTQQKFILYRCVGTYIASIFNTFTHYGYISLAINFTFPINWILLCCDCAPHTGSSHIQFSMFAIHCIAPSVRYSKLSNRPNRICGADRRNQLITACFFCYIRPAPGVLYMNAAQTRDTGANGTPFISILIIIINQGRYKLSSIFITIGRQWEWFISMCDHSNQKKEEKRQEKDMEVKSDSFCFTYESNRP